jgi:glycosyltransferase involved in cell wall biosynthesis
VKIVFITPSYKPAFYYGGPTVSVSELAEALVGIGHSVTVYTTTANGKTELNVPAGKETIVNGVKVYYCKRLTGDHTHVSPALWWKLYHTLNDFDVVHLQSWWSLLLFGAALVCKLKKRKFILSPRGMLSAYSFHNQHSRAKKILHILLGKNLLRKSVLHATSQLEWRDCLQVNKEWNGFVLDNLVNLPKKTFSALSNEKSTVLTIGFLSRIDPKKGIELLLQALAGVHFEYRLLIAGTGDKQYIAGLKTLANELSISAKIEWCGWMAGEEKFRFYESIDLFALTSYNENFAIAVTEALAMGTPVLVTENVGLADYVKAKKLGWVCSTEIESIRNAIVNINKNRERLDEINKIAPDLIVSDFNRETLAKKYTSAYKQTV